ncbi:SDR family oxidoreductase, partial [Aquamicrobium sp.]|uniref:SDR family NAD(P)-dependent oxidoreductase n=1 Tax=Aquamicrobium sp. TaxID=1872579 RepID=UPI002584C1A1
LGQCQEVVAQLREAGGEALAIACHMGRWSDLEQFAEQAFAWKGRVDVLINNAGMSPVTDSSVETSEELFDKVVAVNCKGPFRLSALLGTRMATGEGGSIINVSSVGSVRPRPAYAPYAAAKSGLNAITIAQAFEFAPKVRVNAILPGSFETDIAKHWPEEKQNSIVSAIKRYGHPGEIVSTALYLASSASSFTTGTLIRVDGGRP